MDAVNIPFYVHKVEVYYKMDHVDGLVSVSFHKKISRIAVQNHII